MTVRRLVISPAARADLKEINRYIAQDNPDAAARLVRGIQQRLHNMVFTPFAAPERNDIRPGLRCLTVGNYRIFFIVDDADLTVVRVLHGRQDIKRQFTTP